MKKTKKYVLLGILLFGMTFVLTNCEKDFDNLEESSIKDTPFKMRIIKGDELKKNSSITKKLKKINTKIQQKSSVYNAEYDFYVETDFAKYIESDDGSFHSYTFLIHRNVDNGLLENLVFTSQDDGSYESKIVTYNDIDDNTIDIAYIDINLDSNNYLNKSTTVCTITVTYHLESDLSYNPACPDGPCWHMVIDDINTYCYESYIYGSSSTSSGVSNVIWASNGGGGGSSSTISNSPNFATSALDTDHIKKLEDQTCDSKVKARIEDFSNTLLTDSTERGSEFIRNAQINGIPTIGDTYNEIIIPDADTTFDGTQFDNPVANSEIRLHSHHNTSTGTGLDEIKVAPVPSFDDIWKMIIFYNTVKGLNPPKTDINTSSILVSRRGLYGLRMFDSEKADIFLNKVLTWVAPNGNKYIDFLEQKYKNQVIKTALLNCERTPNCSDELKDAFFEVAFANYFKSLETGLGLFNSLENKPNGCPKWTFITN
jgi:hypothetical protein